VPRGLKRFQQARDLHFITFSCYRRRPKLGDAPRRRVFEQALERVRKQYRFFIRGYVVMPEHVHLLISEPESGFLQERYYDFNVYSERKLVEKLRYIHRNPVTRGLVGRPEDWEWSSFRHYSTGVQGVVEVESQWTARQRERMGLYRWPLATPALAKLGRGTRSIDRCGSMGHPPAPLLTMG
jgi:putative transposase